MFIASTHCIKNNGPLIEVAVIRLSDETITNYTCHDSLDYRPMALRSSDAQSPLYLGMHAR